MLPSCFLKRSKGERGLLWTASPRVKVVQFSLGKTTINSTHHSVSGSEDVSLRVGTLHLFLGSDSSFSLATKRSSEAERRNRPGFPFPCRCLSRPNYRCILGFSRLALFRLSGPGFQFTTLWVTRTISFLRRTAPKSTCLGLAGDTLIVEVEAREAITGRPSSARLKSAIGDLL